MKPEFFKDEDLAELPFWVRILYEGLWCNSDREGRLEDRPLKIKAEIFPYDRIDIEKGLTQLTQPKKHSPTHKPFIVRYSVEGEKYIQIIEFNKHQSPHHTEKDSTIPPFNGELTVNEQLGSGRAQDAPSPCMSSKVILSSLNKTKDKKESICWDGDAFIGLTEKDLQLWKVAYPACDIDLCLSQMGAWLSANPNKRKKNYRQFIVNWLSREQQRGGMTKRGREAGNKISTTPQWVKDADERRRKAEAAAEAQMKKEPRP